MSARGRLGVAGGALLLAILALGLGLRAWGLTRAYQADELANLFGRPFWWAAIDPEAAVNPPLLRMLVNALAPERLVIPLGRVLGVACSTAAVAVTFRLVRGRGTLTAALLAALLVAVHPQSYRMGASCRSYAWSALFAVWHLDALLDALRDGGRDGRRTRQVQLTALVLPWLHYLWVPILGTLAALLVPRHGLRRIASWYAPILSVAIMLPLVATETSTRVASTSILRNLRFVVSLGVRWPPPLDQAGLEVGRRLGWDNAEGLALPALLVSAVLIGVIARWRRLADDAHALAAAAVAVAATAAWVSWVQVVRPPVAILLAAPALPLLALLADRAGRARLPALAAVGWLGTGGLYDDLVDWVEVDRDAGPRILAADLHRWDARRAGRDLLITPTWTLVATWHYLTGDHIMDSAPDPGCPPDVGCFAWDGVRVRTLQPGPLPSGLVLAFEVNDPAELRACPLLEGRPGIWVHDCP